MSSKRAIRRKMCGHKVKRDKESAKLAAHIASRKSGEIIVPYHCKFCGAYHVGHVPRIVLSKLRGY